MSRFWKMEFPAIFCYVLLLCHSCKSKERNHTKCRQLLFLHPRPNLQVYLYNVLHTKTHLLIKTLCKFFEETLQSISFSLVLLSVFTHAKSVKSSLPAKKCSRHAPRKYLHLIWKTWIKRQTPFFPPFFFFYKLLFKKENNGNKKSRQR